MKTFNSKVVNVSQMFQVWVYLKILWSGQELSLPHKQNISKNAPNILISYYIYIIYFILYIHKDITVPLVSCKCSHCNLHSVYYGKDLFQIEAVYWNSRTIWDTLKKNKTTKNVLLILLLSSALTQPEVQKVVNPVILDDRKYIQNQGLAENISKT